MTVVYSKNGVPFYTNSSPGANLTLFLDTAMFTNGYQFGRILSFTAAGPAGADGTNGLNSAVVYLYQRGASAPAAPSGTFTYTFATGALSGGTLNGWTQAIPAANGSPLWVIAATASASATTDSIAAAEFTSPVLKDGAGLNGAPVFLHKRAASAPSVPASTLTYTFATGILSGTLSGWTQSVPANDGNPVYIITATALGTGTTDTIATGEWSTPQILAANGEDGVSALDLAAAPSSLVVPTNSAGVVNSGALPKTIQMAAQLGGSDVTGSVTWPAASVTNCTVTNLGGGAYRVDTVTDDAAEFTVTISYSGQTQTRKVTIAKARAGSDAQQNRVISIGTPGLSWAAATGSTLSLNVYPGTTITMSLLAGYAATSAGSVQVIARLMYRNVTDGGSWTQAGSNLTGSDATNSGGTEPIQTPGEVSGSRTVTPPASPKNYEFRVEWYRDGFSSIAMSGSTFQVAIT